jgi:hypothetical protein
MVIVRPLGRIAGVTVAAMRQVGGWPLFSWFKDVLVSADPFLNRHTALQSRQKTIFGSIAGSNIGIADSTTILG